ncbi:MarR family winged helix-turn-helix transcriptional regulator [Gryllotalpicola protaetiae]|uniref:MarR family transcriptional regulator n=1 Tax=Gryllotalpicola protaetiae TaxID=2419771 RepID=A0A387BVA1_9MICO|nr:MarR family transcriptional regulator [Gryllotalpicola protaetiae]AYG04797.1 MarR family transcriptional regulator [Gryllotalpicola protaetiae]
MTETQSGGEDLIDALAQVAFATMAVLSAAASDRDLSLTQFRAIAILRDRTLRMSELAQFLGLEKSTLSGLVVRAEKRGLLQRVPDDADGRASRVTISPAGERLAVQVRAAVAAALAPLIDGLDAASQAQLQTLLNRMIGHAGQRVA